MSEAVPVAADGTPLVKVTGSCLDKVPTVQYGSVQIGPVSISRWIDARTMQEIIDATRETQKMAEYACGVERRLVTWALDPSSKVQSPVDGSETFASPPAGYNPGQLVDPRDAITPAPPVPSDDVNPPSQAQDLSQTTAAEVANETPEVQVG